MTIAAFSGTSVFLFLRKPMKSTSDIINLSRNSEIKLDKSDEGKAAVVDTDTLIKQEVQ